MLESISLQVAIVIILRTLIGIQNESECFECISLFDLHRAVLAEIAIATCSIINRVALDHAWIVVNGRIRFANRFLIPFFTFFTPSIRESILQLKNRFFDSLTSKTNFFGEIHQKQGICLVTSA